jgi:hypothetical protein
LYLKRLNSNPHAIQAAFGSRNPLSIDLRSFERFKNFHIHGRYRQPILNNSSLFPQARFNNTPVNSPSSSVIPNLAPQMTQIGGGTSSNNAGNNNNFTLPNNIMNSNQMNLYKGVSDMRSIPSTSNSNYSTQVNNNTNYMSMSFPSPGSGRLPIAPFGYRMTNPSMSGHTSSLMGPHFGAHPNLIGGNSKSGTGDGLERMISSFNASWSMPNQNITSNLNNINSDNLGPFFNNLTNAPAMSGGMGTGIESGGLGACIASGGMGADIASGSMGNSIESGSVGTSIASGIGMGTVSGGIGTGTVSSGMGTGMVSSGIEMGPLSDGGGGFGGVSFGAANIVSDPASSSSLQGGDDISISGIDELLASLLKPVQFSVSILFS